jgi:rod shape-determining protein MreD
MSLTPRIAGQQPRGPHPGLDVVRLLAVGLVAVMLQTAISPNVGVLGAHPDFVLIIVVCVALLRGAETGAIFGFAVGGLVSVLLFEPAGIGAFVMVVIGYLAGRYAETVDLSPGLLPVFAVLAASLLGETMYALAQFLLERQVPAYYVATRVIMPSAVLNTLLAAPVYLVVHWVFGGEHHARVLEA